MKEQRFFLASSSSNILRYSASLLLFKCLVIAVSPSAAIVLPATTYLPADVRSWGDPPCSVSYGPLCSCSNGTYGIEVDCNVTSIADYATIRSTFRNSTIQYHNYVNFRLLSDNPVPVPSDVLGGKPVWSLLFSCPRFKSPPVRLGAVASDAFPTGTVNRTIKFYIEYCDLNDFRFNFLQSFTSLEYIFIHDTPLFTLKSMPYLPSLTWLNMEYCTGFEQWYPPSRTPNLRRIDIAYSELDDEKIDYIFAAMEGTVFADKLSSLYLEGNKLTRVPPFVLTLPNLLHLSMWKNSVKSLASGSLKFASGLSFLDLSSNQLETIAPSAFNQSNLSNTKIFLGDNYKLTSFLSNVFISLLKSMVNHSGFVNIENIPITYNCGLRWLVVDNRHLLKYVLNGKIANTTSLDQLNPKDLGTKCPV